jgi:hypothetical protein
VDIDTTYAEVKARALQASLKYGVAYRNKMYWLGNTYVRFVFISIFV